MQHINAQGRKRYGRVTYFFKYMINRVDVFEMKPVSAEEIQLDFEIKDIFAEEQLCLTA